ncbi:beta-galactoside alpha-2,6-sialyltransferase 2 isoform X1 [Maniola hyperantus]|uniref:beta-galactoside alpha-2,6-sialyltransferase 2 isoform X1 n=1 Tax=Aphantopus hyperantus TaxID=2795564 RepID=UPI001567F183|nr:beta-galactoside alpha-2,6-sialyltransferase 2 [Maniola hyperantus]
MKAAAMSVWIFINLLCFGMCGYLYLIWSQYWMSIEKQRLFSKSHNPPSKSIAGISFQETFSKNVHSVINISVLKFDTVRKSRRSVVAFKTGHQQGHNQSSGRQGRPSNNIVVRSRGSPRFPNIHKQILEFDSEKYVCGDYTTQECKLKSNEFKELVLKEFHRVLMSESKVFTSGLVSQNSYDVKYERGSTKYESREDLLCALGRVLVRTVTAQDEPLASLGYHIPNSPLQEGRVFNTCAVVTSAGALLGSRLGEFIDSHDMVLRFNNAPTENYTDDVGSKTTFRVLNSQVVTKPEFNFLEDSLYKNISILIWDPANYSSTLEEWYLHPDFPVFSIYKRLLERRGTADVHLLNPRVLWDLWEVLQDSSAYRLRRNPPSSGFIGLWFAIHRCKRVRVFEYVPSVRATRRCHYHATGDDVGCTLGAWHPLAQEKALAHRMSDNSDLDIFQRGFIDVTGLRSLQC